MKILDLELKNYRNYENQKIIFNNGINVLIGNNAQGKTNLLESIFLCSIGKSPRTNKDKDLILWGKEMGKVSVSVIKKNGNKKIDIYLSLKQNKTININQVPIKKMGELMGEFNSVYFSPDELRLVKESPDERRRFMDIDLSQFDKNYFYTLTKYNRVLQQRNKLLKNTSDKKVISDTINIWNKELADAGAYIIKRRLALIEKLKVYANESLNFLTDGKENMVLEYSGFSDNTLSVPELSQSLMALYEKSLEKDMYLGYTTVGPHRDDFKITINDIDVRSFGSQGQQRTCALALKLAELEVFKDNIGEYPVLLLDDVLSELDDNRQLKLLKRVKDIQTIITGTSFKFDFPHTKFIVKDGRIIL